jgi:pimeloyl-ACP methyl ester carboxylesterase
MAHKVVFSFSQLNPSIMNFRTWKETGQFIEVEKNQIFYQEAGSGPVVLFIHGFPSSSWDWHLVWHPLGEKYHLLAPDLLGFGFSDKPLNHSYSIQKQADILEALLLKKGISEFHIMAHNYGDTVAQELLARQGENQSDKNLKGPVLSVTWLNGGLFPETHQPLLIQRLLMSPLGSMMGRFISKNKLKTNFQRIFGPSSQPTETFINETWQLILEKNGKSIAHKLIRYMAQRKIYRQRWVGALTQTTVPMLLIDGMKDPISGSHMVQRYRELVPEPNIIELSNIGHYPAIESPEILVQHFLAYMDSISTP